MSFTRYHISYSAEEDRIVVFVREGDEVEHAFGLSRRLTKRMWPKMLKAFPAARARVEQVPAPYHNEVRKLDQEGAVSKAKEDGVLAPERMGEVRECHDYLTTAVRITRRKDGARTLVLVSAQRQLNLPLTARHYVLFCEALHTVVGKTDWNIVLHYPWERGSTPSAAEGSEPTPLRH